MLKCCQKSFKNSCINKQGRKLSIFGLTNGKWTSTYIVPFYSVEHSELFLQNLGFNILPTVFLARELEISPLTFQLFNDLLYHLTHSCLIFIMLLI